MVITEKKKKVFLGLNCSDATRLKLQGMIKKNQTVVPRQFLDLGPVSATAEADEISNSSSEERTRDGSRSPLANMEVASLAHNNKVDQDSSSARDGNKRGIRNESPDDSETQGWAANKAPKLEATRTSTEQSVEATMRKARVSVRARSEAPMVIIHRSLDLVRNFSSTCQTR